MQMPGPHNVASRREFLRGTARYGVLSLLAGVTVLGLRKDPRIPGDSNCLERSVCGGCAVLDRCDQPRAASEKLALRGG